jgi:hypothetical protein
MKWASHDLRLRVVRRFLLFAAVLGAARGQDAEEIVRKSLDRDQANFEQRRNYTYQERSEGREYDSQNKLNKTEVLTYEVLVLGGRPYQRLIARGDKPLSAKDERKEQDKLDAESAVRKRESAADRAKLEKERQQQRRYLVEVPRAFVLKVAGVEQVSGKPAWVIEAEPRPGYKPSSLPRANFLTKVRGKFWIDQAEYQWVKADLQVVDTLSFGLGLLRIAPGGSIHFEQTRVNDEVWLPAHITVHADARLAYFKKVREEYDVIYKDYRKFQADSKIVAFDEEKRPQINASERK